MQYPMDTDRRIADRARRRHSGVVKLVSRSHTTPRAEAAFSQWKELSYAHAAHPVLGARRRLFRLLRLLCALGALARGLPLEPWTQFTQRFLRRVALEPVRTNRSLPLHGLVAD